MLNARLSPLSVAQKKKTTWDPLEIFPSYSAGLFRLGWDYNVASLIRLKPAAFFSFFPKKTSAIQKTASVGCHFDRRKYIYIYMSQVRLRTGIHHACIAEQAFQPDARSTRLMVETWGGLVMRRTVAKKKHP